MMRLQSLDAAGRKLKLLVGQAEPAGGDGYSDYDTGHAWNPIGLEQRVEDAVTDETVSEGATPDFAALPLIARFLNDLSTQTTVVLVFPPRHHTALPVPGSAAARRLDACKAAFETIAATRPRTRVIDFAHAGDIAEHDENFRAGIHYRVPLPRRMEGEIAAPL